MTLGCLAPYRRLGIGEVFFLNLLGDFPLQAELKASWTPFFDSRRRVSKIRRPVAFCLNLLGLPWMSEKLHRVTFVRFF